MTKFEPTFFLWTPLLLLLFLDDQFDLIQGTGQMTLRLPTDEKLSIDLNYHRKVLFHSYADVLNASALNPM